MTAACVLVSPESWLDSGCPGMWVRWPSGGWHSRRGHCAAVSCARVLAGGVWGQTPRPSAHVPRMMTRDGLGFPLWAPGLKSKPGTPHSTASRRGKERWSPSDRGGRGSEAWPAAACPRQETPRCFLCPVAATRGLAPAEPNACVCFCGAVHTWGRVDFLRQKLRGDLHLNGDILT